LTHDAELDVAVIGAGPYGMASATHLRHRGRSPAVFGTPMATWDTRMPGGMVLKSEGFASNIADPEGRLTLAAFCAEQDRPYRDLGLPVTLETFSAYGHWFHKAAGLDIDDRQVVELDLRPGRSGFDIRFEDGDTASAAAVVLAVGPTYFAFTPPELAQAPDHLVTHASEHADLSHFAGHEVAVVGAGQSGLETATLLAEAGARPTLIARAGDVRWNPTPETVRSRYQELRYPRAELGGGWDHLFYERAPQVFRRLPPKRRLDLVATVLGPAGAWWLRPRAEGRFPILLRQELVGCTAGAQGRAELALRDVNGHRHALDVDHVIAATGYRPSVASVPFLSEAARAAVQLVPGSGYPELTAHFETSLPGLSVVGQLAAGTFGPVQRFVAGTRPTARSLR
jgi:thioredoxin reductase